MPPPRRPPNKWTVFVVVAVGVFMSTLDGSIVNIALPTIMHDLSVPLSTVEWVMMIYLLTVSSLLLSFGRLSDIRGRRWVYTRGLGAFSAGSLCCALADNAWWLIGSRAFQGVGAAMVMSCTQAIVADAFPESERGKALGTLGAVVASGLMVGPALGGWILHIASWPFIFWINIPIGVATALYANRLLKSGGCDGVRRESFDGWGALLLALCTGALLAAVTHGYDWGYASFPFLSLMALSLLAALGLIFQEGRVRFPLISPSLLRIRLFALPVLAAMILFAGLFTIIFLMPFFLIHPCGFSSRETGLIMVTPFVFLFLFAPVSGALSDRLGSRWLCTTGMVILTAAFVLLSRLEPDFSKLQIAWRMAVSGIGVAMFIAPNNAEVMSAVPSNFMGVAAGTVATVRNLGMVTGIALAGTLFNSVFYSLNGGLPLTVYRPELEPVFMAAFRFAMMSGVAIGGAGILVTFLRGPDRRKRSKC
ncbi:MFS transporter [Desulfococcus sp.]|uniref:MFS transporter n=1 Tax=Desulfococcus sp. TaxID=2025834 RepID=UPI0035938BE9